MLQRGRKSAAALAMVSGSETSGGRRLEAPKPPGHLGGPEEKIWGGVFEDFAISTRASIAILEVALEAHMRARECRETITREGMTIKGRDGQTKAHPLLAVERDARQAFLAAFKTLELEL